MPLLSPVSNAQFSPAPGLRERYLALLDAVARWADPATLTQADMTDVIAEAQRIGDLLGMTQAQVAFHLSISPATWSRLLRGAKIVPDELESERRSAIQQSTRAAVINGLRDMAMAGMKTLIALNEPQPLASDIAEMPAFPDDDC